MTAVHRRTMLPSDLRARVSAKYRWSLLVAGEAAVTLFLLTWGNSFTGSVELHRIQLGVLAFLGAIGWLAILRRPSRLPIVLIVAPLPLLGSLALTAATSAYPGLGWYATWQCAAYAGIAWLLAVQAGHPIGRRNLIASMGIVVAVVIGLYLAEVASTWIEWVGMGFPVTSVPLRPLRDGGVVQLPTWVGDVIVLCTPVVAVRLWIANARTPAVVLAIASMSAMVISGTRSVLLLVVVLSVVVAAVYARLRGTRRAGILASTLAVVVIVIGLGAVVLAGRSFDEGRSSSYASAIEQFASSPVTGTGPGTYAVHRMSDTVDVLAALPFPDANNVVLTAAGESGLIGILGLALALIGYGIAAVRSWRRAPGGHAVVGAALFGLAIFAGHAMVDAVFVLMGVVLLMIASISIAVTDDLPPAIQANRSRPLDVALGIAIVVIVIGTAFVVRNERVLNSVRSADSSLTSSLGEAIVSALAATEISPETVPAWWARMLAQARSGDLTDATADARQTIGLEGFGQEWLMLALLDTRIGDRAGARDALDHATAHPPFDPVVELNAAMLYMADHDSAKASGAIRRLLVAQPDIEPLLATAQSTLADVVEGSRSAAATDSLAAGDPDSALAIALYGSDRSLANSVLDRVAVGDPNSAHWRTTVVAAWFGDLAARASLDAEAAVHPSVDRLVWAWRVAAHACDEAASNWWERAVEIAAGYQPSVPVAIGVAPDFQARLLPNRYPGVVWRMDYPSQPYVDGTWTFALGQPACAAASSR